MRLHKSHKFLPAIAPVLQCRFEQTARIGGELGFFRTAPIGSRRWTS